MKHCVASLQKEIKVNMNNNYSNISSIFQYILSFELIVQVVYNQQWTFVFYRMKHCVASLQKEIKVNMNNNYSNISLIFQYILSFELIVQVVYNQQWTFVFYRMKHCVASLQKEIKVNMNNNYSNISLIFQYILSFELIVQVVYNQQWTFVFYRMKHCVASLQKEIKVNMNNNYSNISLIFQYILSFELIVQVVYNQRWTFVFYRIDSCYRLGTVNSKSFIGKVLLWIKWKFELNSTLYFEFQPKLLIRFSLN